MTSTALLKSMIEKLPAVASRPMFGYHCYMVNGKFFVGFDAKNTKLIVRLSKDMQEKAINSMKIKAKPFSRGAKKGWIEIDLTEISKAEDVLHWIHQGHDHARRLYEPTGSAK
jgi:hypothetical protein